MRTKTQSQFSLGELGDLLSVQAWRVARLFELGILEEPPRIGRRRIIPAAMIPAITDALRTRGWLPNDVEAIEPEDDRGSA